MEKKGQVTIYVAVGIVILIIVSLSVYIFSQTLKTSGGEETQTTQFNIEGLNEYVLNCFSNVSYETINAVYHNGGYVTPPEILLLNYYNTNVTCLYCNSNNMLTLTDVENQINNYLTGNPQFIQCINDFQPFKDKKFNIISEPMNVKTEISDRNIAVILTYPLTITKGEDVDTLNTFTIIDNRELGLVFKAVKDRLNEKALGQEFDIGDYIVNNPEIKIEGQFFDYDSSSDFERLQYYTINQPENIFVFGLYEPLENPLISANKCCIDDSLCYQGINNCLGEEVSSSCESLSQCQVTPQGGNINRPNNCELTDITICGTNQDIYLLDACGYEAHLIEECDRCDLINGQPQCVSNDCSVELKDDFGLNGNHNLINGESMCVRYNGPGEQHYKIYCQNGEVKAEGYGVSRERICVNNKREKNDYHDCIKCGDPAELNDWSLFALGDRTGAFCTQKVCEGIGDCKATSFFNTTAPKIGNVQCYPLYAPGNIDSCLDCGFGGDDKANSCDKNQCQNLGWCTAEPDKKVNNVFTKTDEGSLCLSFINLLTLNNGDLSLLSDFCNIDDWLIYYLVRDPLKVKDYFEYQREEFEASVCKISEKSALNKCELCGKSFEKCTKEECEFLGDKCEFTINNTFGECNFKGLDIDNQAPIIEIYNPNFEDKFNWNDENVLLNVKTNENAQCRYSYNTQAEWDGMITLEDKAFKLEHSDTLVAPASLPNNQERKYYFIVRCRDEFGNSDVVNWHYTTAPKSQDEAPVIIFVNLQGKETIENKLIVSSDIDGTCKYEDITEEVLSNNRIDQVLEGLTWDSMNDFDECNYVYAESRTICNLIVNTANLGNKYMAVQCENSLSGLRSEIMPVTFKLI